MTPGAGHGNGATEGGLIDWRAVATGAAVALAIAVPVIVASSVIGIDDESSVIFLVFLLYLGGQTAGGWTAARRRLDAPLSNGATAAICAYTLLAAVSSVIRIAQGDDLDPVSLILNAFLAASAGLLGGLIATWNRPSSSAEKPPEAGRPGSSGSRPG